MAKVGVVTNCCTAKNLYGFPSNDAWNYSIYPTVEQIKKQCSKAKKDGHAIVIALLTSRQMESIAILKKVGFVSTRAVEKTRHSDTKLYLLNLKLDTWKETK